MIPPPRNSHWALAPKNRPPRRHQICDCNILQLLQYMRRIQWITSHPVHHSTLKHESGQSTIIPNPQSWISGDLFREIPENWSTTILGNSLATRRFRSLWFVQGIHPIPSDQSDHPRKPLTSGDFNSPSLQQIQKNPLRFLVVFFWIFPAGTLRTLFGLFFPPVPTSVTRSSSATWTFFSSSWRSKWS